MQAEHYEDPGHIEDTLSRLRERTDGRLELPEVDKLRQSGPFRSQQQFFNSAFQNFRELLYFTGLQPGWHVLDYGCGLARLAIPMSAFLDPEKGAYMGVDTDRKCIARNRKMLRDLGHFRFKHVDLYSRMYNRRGKGMGRLKWQRFGSGYDLAFLFSVFTHVLPEDCDTLLQELCRRLKPGAELFTSWFLLNDRTRQAIEEGRSHRAFATPWKEAFIDNPEVPEGAVAYEDGDVLARLERCGFCDVRVHYGKWRGNLESWVWQDVIVCRRA